VQYEGDRTKQDIIDFIEKNRDKIGQQEPAKEEEPAKEQEPAKDELWEKHIYLVMYQFWA